MLHSFDDAEEVQGSAPNACQRGRLQITAQRPEFSGALRRPVEFPRDSVTLDRRRPNRIPTWAAYYNGEDAQCRKH